MRSSRLASAMLFVAAPLVAQQQMFVLQDAGGLPMLWTIDPFDGAARTSHVQVKHALGISALAEFGGQLYSLDNMGVWSTPLPTHLMAINPADGSSHDFVQGPHKSNGGMAFEIDPSSGVGYAIIDLRLFSANLRSGTFTWIADIDTNNDGLTALAIDSRGNAYATGVNGPRLYQLDLKTGVATKIAYLSLGSGVFNDIAFAADGRLWGTYLDAGSSHINNGLYVIDLSPTVVVHHVQWFKLPFAGIAFGPAPRMDAYCVSKPNSLGCSSSIEGVGIPSVSAKGGFEIRAANVLENQPATLIFGTSGRAQIPFEQGTLCVAAPLNFTPAAFTHGGAASGGSCDAIASIDFNQFSAHAAHHPELRVPGTMVECQWYVRDPGFAAPDGVALSNALEFVLQP